MNSNSIDSYLSELEGILNRTLAPQDVEEIVAEARNHLYERATELQAAGLHGLDAEQQSTREFGAVEELAVELTDGYPPKPPYDVRHLGFLPEITVGLLLALTFYSYSIFGGVRGVEAAVQNLLPGLTSLMIPGVSVGVSRVRYRRVRPIKFIARMAAYGFGLNLIGTLCLIALQVSGHVSFPSLLPIYYTFSAVTTLAYFTMRSCFQNGRIFTTLPRRTSRR